MMVAIMPTMPLSAHFCAFLVRFWDALQQKLAFSPTPPALAPRGEGAQLRARLYAAHFALLLIRKMSRGNLVCHGIQHSYRLAAMI